MPNVDREEAIRALFELHKRHAHKVNGVLDTVIAANISSIRKGTLPETCLINMVARGEHLKVGRLLKGGKGKQTQKKVKKKKRKVSSELTRRDKGVYALAYVQGKTSKQATIEMQCSPQNISQLLKKAERKMNAQTSRSVNLAKAQKLPEDKRGQVNVSEEEQ